MKSWQKSILIFTLSAGVLGIVVMISGIVPIKASSGHFFITEWILQFSMKRSVSTYSIGIKAPSLTSPHLIQRGAGHYELGCRQCHGATQEAGLLGKITNPKASHLPGKISRWSPQELFTLVKHGVNFTGMPAWPELKRDDEVWAMVAFLLKLPELNEEEYKQMVYADLKLTPLDSSSYSHELKKTILYNCANCHGVDGNGRKNGHYPKLAGQNPHYLSNSLKAFSQNLRHSGTMKLAISKLEEDMIEAIAGYYGKQKRHSSPSTFQLEFQEKQQAIKNGERLAREGIPQQKVAACLGCHKLQDTQISKDASVVPYPDLRGQPAEYLINQLELYVANKRGGSKHIELMQKAVPSLTSTQIRDLSLYFESLGAHK